jgi:hypothetical protein
MVIVDAMNMRVYSERHHQCRHRHLRLSVCLSNLLFFCLLVCFQTWFSFFRRRRKLPRRQRLPRPRLQPLPLLPLAVPLALGGVCQVESAQHDSRVCMHVVYIYEAPLLECLWHLCHVAVVIVAIAGVFVGFV